VSLRCVVVEDQVMFLQLLVGLLRSQAELEVVATAQTVAQGVDACREHCPDLLILDLALPDGEGVAVAEALQLAHPPARVIVLSGQASSFVCPAPLQPMVHAVIDKTRAYDALLQEVDRLRGAAGDGADRRARLESLTARERQIFALIGQGTSSRDIAEALQLSPHTVETHRRNITGKLGVSGAELVRLAAMELPTA
jgi:DNA-binding NarL/FixJ family response regulator